MRPVGRFTRVKSRNRAGNFKAPAGRRVGLEECEGAPIFVRRQTLEDSMDKAEQLHFQRLPAEAQFEALWRLALSGMSVEEVAERTGWTPERIRRAISPEPPKAVAPWRAARRAQSEVRA